MALRVERPDGYPSGLREFVDKGLITEPVRLIAAGKEAAAYLVAGTKTLGVRQAVVKVYHERNQRNFGNDAIYQEGRVILDARARRSAASRTEFGRHVQQALWIDHEFEILSELAYAGADVPAPFAATEAAILMEFAGTGDTPATQLQRAQLDPAEVHAVFERLIWNVEVFLRSHWVHGDLSAFNILYAAGQIWIIDFPQTVDARTNPHAQRLLRRDLRNLETHFRKYGVGFDSGERAGSLWRRYGLAEL